MHCRVCVSKERVCESKERQYVEFTCTAADLKAPRENFSGINIATPPWKFLKKT